MMGDMMGAHPEPSPLERQIEYLKKARTDEQKETVKKRIRNELVQQYDAYLAASSDELKNLETRLAKLRSKLIVRKEAKEKMIDLELQRIVIEAEGLSWPKKMKQRNYAGGFGDMGMGNQAYSGGYAQQNNPQPELPQSSPRIEPLEAAERKPTPFQPAQFNYDKSKTENCLKQIGLASITYETVWKHFPNDIEDEIGTPLLSWRVAILPFVGERDLFEKFHLDEPWDSQHNKKLLSEMPSIYGASNPEGRTNRFGIADRGGIFEPGVKVSFASISDGSSNTILCVALKDQSRFWTEPSDLTIDQFVDFVSGESLIVSFCDGSVFELADDISRADLRRLAIRNDGEVVNAHTNSK